MMEFAKTGSFAGNTISWSPLSLALLLCGVLIILCGPRKWILPTFLTLAVLMSLALHVVVFGQNLMVHRILLLCAWIRVLVTGEHRGFQLATIDKVFILFGACMILMETVQNGSEGFVYAVANSGLDALGTYFLCRILFRGGDDLKRAVFSLAIICSVVAGFMAVEFVTGRNWLAALGAVQDMVVERQGRKRCAASFSISITAGTFGALFLPLFIACWWQGGRMKKWAIPGCLASTVITFTSGSASPLSTWIIAILAWLAWPLRGHMRKIRWATAFSLLVLHMIMKAPVWALIMRVQVVPGASAYHRFNILDTFIRHIGDWWLCGVRSTEGWGWEVDDVANQYCVIAKHGGLLALALFVWIIALGFREVGVALKSTRQDRPAGLLVWAFGVLLFAHATAFFGISYFDQIKVFWYLSVAMVASVRLLAQEQEDLQTVEPQEDVTSSGDLSRELPATAS